MEQTKSRKGIAVIALLALVAVLAVGGTIAWLTASNHVTNSFTVGEITQPDPEVPDKPDPDKPDPGKDNAVLEGNIYEIYKQNSTIIPGGQIAKEPYIGIGKNSEDAFVFAYIDNKMMAEGAEADNSTYFTLGEGWKAVEGAANAYGEEPNAYTDGLFVWCGEGETATALKGSEANAVWTGKIFDKVIVPDAAVADDFAKDATMDVYCYIYAAVEDATADTATAAAKAWVADEMPAISGTAAATE